MALFRILLKLALISTQVAGAESHAQMEQDWYMLTVAADLLAFLYVALFYQVIDIAGSAHSWLKGYIQLYTTTLCMDAQQRLDQNSPERCSTEHHAHRFSAVLSLHRWCCRARARWRT